MVHVVSPEEEAQQQKLDLLWWRLDEQAPLTQVGRDGAQRPQRVKGARLWGTRSRCSPGGTSRKTGEQVSRGAGREGATEPGGKGLELLEGSLLEHRQLAEPLRLPDTSTWCVAQ